MIGYIYYIINKETGKSYVGQTLDVKVIKIIYIYTKRNTISIKQLPV